MATTRDHYEVLGVARGASEDQIRSAYRRLARQYHPDVNDADDAAARFREVTEAYEVLSDPQRRQRYDMFGSGGGFGDFGIGDIFETFFGGDRRRERGPMRGADLRMEIELELVDAVRGGERVISVPRLENCERCGGSGGEPGTGTSTCATCGGRGEVRQMQQSVFGRFVNVATCPRCGGAGRTIDSPCATCRGEGRQRKDREIRLVIPAGIDDGQQLRVSGEGEVGGRGGPAGDLYVLVRLAEDRTFRRDGDDLIHALRVSPAQAALGEELEVPLIEGGKAKVKVPSGAQHGEVVRLRGKGVPRLGRSGRGDQLVVLEVVVPRSLSKEERHLYGKLRELSGTPVRDDEDDRDGRFDRIRDAFGGS
ncbi:MAG: molecular chaperone DnaJ [Candidatus Limnocylindria bacterium]